MSEQSVVTPIEKLEMELFASVSALPVCEAVSCSARREGTEIACLFRVRFSESDDKMALAKAEQLWLRILQEFHVLVRGIRATAPRWDVETYNRFWIVGDDSPRLVRGWVLRVSAAEASDIETASQRVRECLLDASLAVLDVATLPESSKESKAIKEAVNAAAMAKARSEIGGKLPADAEVDGKGGITYKVANPYNLGLTKSDIKRGRVIRG